MRKEEKKKNNALETKTEGSQPSTHVIKQARDPVPKEKIGKLSIDAAEIHSSINEPLQDSEQQPKSAAGQTAAPDPRNDTEHSSVNIAPQTDQSQCNFQLSAVPHQQVDNEQSSPPDAKVGNEKSVSTDPEIRQISQIGNALDSNHQTDTRHSPDAEIHQSGAIQPRKADESVSHSGEGDNKCEEISLSTQPKPVASDSSSENDGNENESIDLSADADIASFVVTDCNKDLAVPKKLRERIVSSNQDMPQFPPDESDISVLHTVQSFCLQELLESQAGECYSSGAARDLARYLPRLEMLESLVLVGTILSSDAICDFAKSAYKLPNLKKLDLRLNKQFDNRAFVAVTNLLLRQCRKLTDLRLSLYKVTDEGFDQVEKEMRNAGGHGWGRLKTLYLLHGSPADVFVGFLSNSLKYFHSVECFHLSASCKSEKIHDNIHGAFDQNMTNPNVMTHLEDLDIGNMKPLKARLASLKLPKKKKGSVI